MNQEKKLERVLDIALNDDLDDYEKLAKILKKKLPFFNGVKRIAAALLKDLLGDISRLELSDSSILNRTTETGKIVFEDIKDGKARLFINIGKSHYISTGDLIKEIVKRSGIDGKLIGKIDIHSTYSFFEVPELNAEIVYHAFDGAKIKGIPVVVEPAKKRRRQTANKY